jgi:hypothetical protein
MADPNTLSLTTALLTAAASGVVGIIVGEIFSYLRERRRGVEDAAENDKRRRHELRREVYLLAAETTVRAMAALGRLSNPRIPNEDSERAAEAFNASMARVNMVANPGTIRRTSEMQRSMAILHIELMVERQSLVLRQTQMDRIESRAEAHNHDVQRFIEMLKMLNIEGRGNENRFSAVERQAEIANQNMLGDGKLLEQLWSDQQTDQKAFLERLLPRLERIAHVQVNALVAIRADLGVDDAVDVLRQELSANLEAVHGVLTRSLAQVWLPKKDDQK